VSGENQVSVTKRISRRWSRITFWMSESLSTVLVIEAEERMLRQETLRLERAAGHGLRATSPARSKSREKRKHVCRLEQRLSEAKCDLEKKSRGMESRH
jgi:hypothetical protein